jgi:HEAT repeat protein
MPATASRPALPRRVRRHQPQGRTLLLALLALGTAFALLPAAQLLARGKPSNNNDGVAAAKTLLMSNDHDQIEAGIQSLGLIGSPAGVGPIMDRVRAGLPPDLLETSILTLSALGQPQAGPLLFELVDHRRPEIRLRAIEAIVALKPQGSEPVLQRALSDQDTHVRSAAALALGELKAPTSVEVLFQALDHGNFEASTAIGRSLRADHVPRLLGYLGNVPFHSLVPALTEILQRKDIPERDKLTVVSRVQDVGTREVKDFFGDLMRGAGEKLPPNVSKAVLTAMQEIAD